MLRLDDRWVWDFWIADTGEDYHAFFLQAPKSLGDPLRRHRHATIGHAASRDLVEWRSYPDALGPGPAGAWDDLATWTGSVIEHGCEWWMLYTGTSTAESGRVQRIGLATSHDLVRWTKHPRNPVLEADVRWYELSDGRRSQAWRDPWVFRDPAGDGFHAFVTARVADGSVSERGVIAHASSADLVEWAVRPPLTQPGDFGELEVPQVVEIGGRDFLVFSVGADHVSQRLRERLGSGRSAVLICKGGSPLGPFDVRNDAMPVGLPGHYAGRVVVDRQGLPHLLAFVEHDGSGRFVGELCDPQPISVADLIPLNPDPQRPWRTAATGPHATNAPAR